MLNTYNICLLVVGLFIVLLMPGMTDPIPRETFPRSVILSARRPGPQNISFTPEGHLPDPPDRAKPMQDVVSTSWEFAEDFLYLRLEFSVRNWASEGVLLYFDTDCDPATGSTYLGALGPPIKGWERKVQLVLDSGDLYFSVVPDSRVIFRTEQEGSVVFFRSSQGWCSSTGGECMLTIPLEVLGLRPGQSFCLTVVDNWEETTQEAAQTIIRVATDR
jgi:hypothetical protein